LVSSNFNIASAAVILNLIGKSCAATLFCKSCLLINPLSTGISKLLNTLYKSLTSKNIGNDSLNLFLRCKLNPNLNMMLASDCSMFLPWDTITKPHLKARGLIVTSAHSAHSAQATIAFLIVTYSFIFILLSKSRSMARVILKGSFYLLQYFGLSPSFWGNPSNVSGKLGGYAT
jgi:hypothetical protein